MTIDIPEVVAEVTAAFARYEQALVSNDVAVLDTIFRDDPRTVRYGTTELLYGYEEIKAFRAARSPLNLMRTLSKTVITTFGRDFAVASTLFHRTTSTGKVGRQTQTWVRFDDGWHVVAAHVSVIDEFVVSEARMTIAGTSGRRTLAEELRLQLADEIVRGALTPGTALDEMDLARRFQVSRTPVREAIRQLTASGLIEARAHRGAVVARPSEARLAGMFEVMSELELLCAGLSAIHMTINERRALETAHEEMRALIHVGDPQRFHEVNEAFHGAIYAGAHNDYLAEITLATRVRVQPFRRAQFRNLGRLSQSHAEHDRVVVAILRGDRPRAADAMQAHIRTVRDEYEHYAERGTPRRDVSAFDAASYRRTDRGNGP